MKRLSIVGPLPNQLAYTLRLTEKRALCWFAFGLLLSQFRQHVGSVLVAAVSKALKLHKIAPFACELDKLVRRVLVAAVSEAPKLHKIVPFASKLDKLVHGIAIARIGESSQRCEVALLAGEFNKVVSGVATTVVRQGSKFVQVSVTRRDFNEFLNRPLVASGGALLQIRPCGVATWLVPFGHLLLLQPLYAYFVVGSTLGEREPRRRYVCVAQLGFDVVWRKRMHIRFAGATLLVAARGRKEEISGELTTARRLRSRIRAKRRA
jgi:hypothetical protein